MESTQFTRDNLADKLRAHGINPTHQRIEIAFALFELPKLLDQPGDLGVLARQLAKALHVARDARVAERRVEFVQAQREALELLAEGVFHAGTRR